MKKIIMLLCVVCLLAVCAQAAEVNLIAVVDGGRISSTGTYYTIGGTNPYFENQYISSVSANGKAGIVQQGTFNGPVVTKEQLEVQSGWGKFETKIGTGTLVNTTSEDTGIVSGVLKQNAIGFSGTLTKGMVGSAFDTKVFSGAAEAQMTGSLQAGGIQIVTIGTSEAGSVPQTAEYFKGYWSFGPGQIQAKVEITFPK